MVTLPLFTREERDTLERYSKAIFGCEYDDLSDNKQKLLVAHVRDREPDFQRRKGMISYA